MTITLPPPPAPDATPEEKDARLRELMEVAKEWPREKRDQLYDMIQDALGGERRTWYCTIDGKPGRGCDGKPHEGYDYPHARDDQWPPLPMNWLVWFLSSGRGSGKTRTGAEYTRWLAARLGKRGRIALVGPTIADVRDTMIEGDSGLEYVCALAGEKIVYEPSKRRVTFPSGCIATTFSAEKPKRLRGPQHHFAWLDEPAHMENIETVWSNLLFGLRLGTNPHIVCTSTPIPSPWVKEIQAEETTRVTRVSTFKNLHNLAAHYAGIVKKYVGTRLGRQELEGEVLGDVEGALWTNEMIRYAESSDLVEGFDRIVVAIDPAGTANRRSDETGIVVVGRRDETGYVLDDYSGKYSPAGWAAKAMYAYDKWHADAIVVEVNFGADMVKETIRHHNRERGLDARIIEARAMRGKQLRAEPVVMLYEQEKILHRRNLQRTQVKPNVFVSLESEMTEWVPNPPLGQKAMPSPNRIDAMVWGFFELFRLGPGPGSYATPKGRLPQNPALDRVTKGRQSPWKKPSFRRPLGH